MGDGGEGEEGKRGKTRRDLTLLSLLLYFFYSSPLTPRKTLIETRFLDENGWDEAL